jgi:hypothetical protein
VNGVYCISVLLSSLACALSLTHLCAAAAHLVNVVLPGDSVAVLARGSSALRLTELHRPDNEAEAARVLAAGGMLCRGKGSCSCLRVKQNPATLPAGERYARQPMLAVTR